MHFCVSTPERGWTLRPDAKWDGDPEFEFIISGRSGSNYATDPETMRSVKGHSTFLNGNPIVCKNGMQKKSGSKSGKPMILETDNRGFCDLANNWAVTGRTRHEVVQWTFLRELKEQGALRVIWIP
eukprot:3265550-Ditylum_brightwellii.AAC.1